MRMRVRRLLALLLLILALAPGTWLREGQAPRRDETAAVRFTRLPLPAGADVAAHLGAFTLEAAWEMTGTFSGFGSYSALLPRPDGRLMAISDSGRYLTFAPPGVPSGAPSGASPGASSGVPAAALESGSVVPEPLRRRRDLDIEAAAQDPAGDTIWLAREDSNAISRHDPAFRDAGAYVRPAAMRGWRRNRGPEAMARLADGRFIVLQEGFAGLFAMRRHHAVLFARDPLRGGPAVEFTFAGPLAFDPTDMAQIPDGRVLILMRRLVWPLPLRFSGRIVVADPAAIRPGGPWRGHVAARLTAPLPVDNFEGLAIVPGRDGRVTVWMISDANNAATQRTLLWKMTVDPARLPGARKKARSSPSRPHAQPG